MSLVTIFGGAGFVGRYVAQRMAARGWRVRVASRRPNEALFVRTYGVVGQVEPIFANIRDDDSVRAAVASADAVMNCVGILAPSGKNTFEATQAEGAGRIARLAAEAGAKHMCHLSAIGADPESDSAYGKTKAEGERLVQEAFADAVILRPSIVFGHEDQFFNRFAGMARLAPVLPVVGGATRFQPVYVGDVAAAAEAALTGAAPGIYELGGPDIETFEGLMRRMLAVIRRKRGLVDLPLPLARFMAWGLETAETVTFGLFQNTQLTRDQIKLLAKDNVVAEGAKTLGDLGITPTAMDAVLEEYLYCYRPRGQYSDLARAEVKRQE